ncbi:hypothetical protein [Streptomyces sp. NPDC096132]|uniref:hypothetical protein n=1 Tax=Streptomyces sp. NPDC096132 TaxID=3366075 RepID=UPI00382CB5CF
MAEFTAQAALVKFAQIANFDSSASLEDRLRESGWLEQPPGARGLHREWRNGEIGAVQYGRGLNSFLEVAVDVVLPDPEDPDSEERLTVEFEDKFERILARCASTFGAAAFVGSYGDEGFPRDVDAVMVALWPARSGVIALNFKHEDWGVPFRITVTVG